MVTIDLSQDEALVLFECLSRFKERGAFVIEDQAEERVLWDVHCVLEKVLVEPFQADYRAKVDAARDRTRDASD